MTDPGLTDLIAAQIKSALGETPYATPEMLADPVALVVEQNANGRIAEVEAKYATLLGRNEYLVARRRVSAAMLRGAHARAEKAEAKVTTLESWIADARSILQETGRYNAARTKHWNIRVFACDVLAALDGEQR